MIDRKTQKAAKQLTSISKERLIELVGERMGYGRHYTKEVVDHFDTVTRLIAEGDTNG